MQRPRNSEILTAMFVLTLVLGGYEVSSGLLGGERAALFPPLTSGRKEAPPPAHPAAPRALDADKLDRLLGLPPRALCPECSKPWDSIVRLREGEYELSRAAFTYSETAGQGCIDPYRARVVPYTKGGVTKGFRLMFWRGSPYEKLGLRSGDAVTRINGLPLTTPEEGLEAYTRLRNATRIELEIERAGRPLRRTYWIR